MTVARRNLEYVLLPRSKRGFDQSLVDDGLPLKELEEVSKLVQESGALLAIQALGIDSLGGTGKSLPDILFTGTGSALPCKHRNVSGICLTLDDDRRILLDCGEGTFGQLLRANLCDKNGLLHSIKAVWISHPHADHHLGILRLLAERKALGAEPLLLVAPPCLYSFLQEYEEVDPTVSGSYHKIDCYTLDDPHVQELLKNRLGIKSMRAVPVSHCRHAFAVIIDSEELGRVAYSGDCRPSPRFATEAIDADILIHEATFEDGLENEAILKKHSTIGEALSVATQMRAKSVLLTHFSQRYPRIPPIKHSSEDKLPPTVFCFDFMRVSRSTIPMAAKLTDILRLLYPEEKGSTEESVEVDELLAVPGLFAKNELL
jgi:ribonuclease Z